MLKMLIENHGVHEPQEERVFYEVLKTIPARSVMIELGSYWAFYSMWFYTSVEKPTCYMIEPREDCMEAGKRNFNLNRMHGHFFRALIGEKSSLDDNHMQTFAIDDFVIQQNINFVHILHADIQGKEFEMLQGAKRLIEDQKVGYIFISTHSNEFHAKCLEFLDQYHFILIASVDLDETYSYDGLIVVRAPYFDGINPVDLSKKGNTVNV